MARRVNHGRAVLGLLAALAMVAAQFTVPPWAPRAAAADTTPGSVTLQVNSARATFTLTNSPGAAIAFAITSAPVTGPASATVALGPITVQLQDLYGNPVSSPAGGTEVTLASDSTGPMSLPPHRRAPR